MAGPDGASHDHDGQGSSPPVAGVAVVTKGAARDVRTRVGPFGGPAEIVLERLHYGKLAAGADLSIPADEGYGVTRRSSGLDPAFDGALSPPRLIGARRLNRDLVDEAAWRRGFLLARAAPDWPGAGEPPLALLRARFRHEDGDKGQGRLYQQSAVWLADFALWRRHPDALLLLAGAGLEAHSDLAGESAAARLACPPLARPLPAPLKVAPGGGVAILLDVLTRHAGREDGCLVTFGAGCDFKSETEFLAAVGAALRQLPRDFPRWRDIVVLSGLRQRIPGLCLRFLPSYRGTED